MMKCFITLKLMQKMVGILAAMVMMTSLTAQSITTWAHSISVDYNIPELAFAVVSSDTVYEMNVSGLQRSGSALNAKPTDRFHIGSNTKAITSYLAAILVQEGKLQWETKFFELFPLLKANSRKEYHKLTLQQLLSFRASLPAYTYTFPKPTTAMIKGSEAEQHMQLAKYFLVQPPMPIDSSGLVLTNAGYVLAGLMLEKASGQDFKTLVTNLGQIHGIDFGFNYPNLSDSLQPWGHDSNLKPLPPAYNEKLNWLLSAGNININLPDYIKFIQLLLKDLKGKMLILPQQTVDHLLFGLPVFSLGWFKKKDAVTGHHIAYNEGAAGAFITQVYIVRETGKAFIIFTNAATDKTREGITVLLRKLEEKYSW